MMTERRIIKPTDDITGDDLEWIGASRIECENCGTSGALYVFWDDDSRLLCIRCLLDDWHYQVAVFDGE